MWNLRFWIHNDTWTAPFPWRKMRLLYIVLPNQCLFTLHITVKGFPWLFQWLFRPHCTSDRRNLIGDFLCFLLLTPLAVVSTWLCASGAIEYARVPDGHWEASGLLMLSIFLVIIYFLWCVVSVNITWQTPQICFMASEAQLTWMTSLILQVAVRHHRKIFQEWCDQNERVRVLGAEMEEGKDERPTAVVHTPHFVTTHGLWRHKITVFCVF